MSGLKLTITVKVYDSVAQRFIYEQELEISGFHGKSTWGDLLQAIGDFFGYRPADIKGLLSAPLDMQACIGDYHLLFDAKSLILDVAPPSVELTGDNRGSGGGSSIKVAIR